MENNKVGFLEEKPGHKSNSRLIALICICGALFMAQEVLLFTLLAKGEVSMVAAAAAAGTLFITIATPALVFVFNQKKTENKKPEQ